MLFQLPISPRFFFFFTLIWTLNCIVTDSCTPLLWFVGWLIPLTSEIPSNSMSTMWKFFTYVIYWCNIESFHCVCVNMLVCFCVYFCVSFSFCVYSQKTINNLYYSHYADYSILFNFLCGVFHLVIYKTYISFICTQCHTPLNT